MSKPEPRFIGCRPAFRIHDSEQAIAHYVDWLGFNLDFEWRAEHGAPTIMSVSRDSLSLFLNEDAPVSEKSWLRVQSRNWQSSSLSGMRSVLVRLKSSLSSLTRFPQFTWQTHLAMALLFRKRNQPKSRGCEAKNSLLPRRL